MAIGERGKTLLTYGLLYRKARAHACRWVDDKSTSTLITGFDQEAAAVLVARLGSWKMEGEEEFDATRWLDRLLIRVSSRFGDYQANDPRTFDLQPNMALFPQFLFNLRRSQFVQVAGRDSCDH